MNPSTAISEAVASLEAARVGADEYREIADADLLELSRQASRVRQLADAQLAIIAGEVARRSAHELGSAGMAQRLGLRTAEELVRVTNRSTAREASAAVRVGRIVATEEEPWLAPVSRSIMQAGLPVASADAIRTG